VICDLWSIVYDIWSFDTMKWYDVWFYCLLNVVLWDCLMLQFVGLARLYDVCSVLMLIPIHRFMSISGFVKDKRVSGHMRWGIAFGPRCKSLPSGMCRYLLSNILNLDPGNLNPSANIYINMCVCVVSWQSTLGYLGPAHRSWWAVWFRWNPASFTSPLILVQHRSWQFYYIPVIPVCYMFSDFYWNEAPRDGLRRSETVSSSP
jgi:hypothetical protein